MSFTAFCTDGPYILRQTKTTNADDLSAKPHLLSNLSHSLVHALPPTDDPTPGFPPPRGQAPSWVNLVLSLPSPLRVCLSNPNKA